MPPLADYGGGSGCGAMFFHDERWPKKYNNLLLTCDWGRSMVFSHDLPKNGATFDAQQSDFLKVPRVTDICVDGSGRMYVSSWKNGRFGYDGPNVGFVAMVSPANFVPKPVPDFEKLTEEELVAELRHPSAVRRMHAQRRIVDRSREVEGAKRTLMFALAPLLKDSTLPHYARVAGNYTLKEVYGREGNGILGQFYPGGEDYLRILADRSTQLEDVEVNEFVDGLKDTNPRTQAAALIGLGRLPVGKVQQIDPNLIGSITPLSPSVLELKKVVPEILPLTAIDETAPVEGDDWRIPHAQRVIPHLAVQTLIRLNAVDECLAALTGSYRDGALWALKSMHDKRTVDGLFKVLSTSRDDELRRDVWTALIRLYHREGEFVEGESPKWWGTRPDTTGPYCHRVKWSESDRIAAAIKVAMAPTGCPHERLRG